MLILGNEMKCIYLANPKTGSTYIREIIRFTNKEYYKETLDFNKDLYSNYEYHPHKNYNDMKVLLNKYNIDLDKSCSFTTIRNPWDCMVSYYRYCVFDDEGRAYWEADYNEEKIGMYSFESFIRDFQIVDSGVCPLDKYAFDTNGNQLVSKIFKIESLNIKELISFFNENNIECDKTYDEFYRMETKKLKIMPINSKNYIENNTSYRDYYTKQWMVDKVATIFKKDIEIGNYVFLNTIPTKKKSQQ